MKRRPTTSFQRTLTRGGFGPLNSDREIGAGLFKMKKGFLVFLVPWW